LSESFSYELYLKKSKKEYSEYLIRNNEFINILLKFLSKYKECLHKLSNATFSYESEAFLSLDSDIEPFAFNYKNDHIVFKNYVKDIKKVNIDFKNDPIKLEYKKRMLDCFNKYEKNEVIDFKDRLYWYRSYLKDIKSLKNDISSARKNINNYKKEKNSKEEYIQKARNELKDILREYIKNNKIINEINKRVAIHDNKGDLLIL
jgi:hypothetical protein